MSSRLVEVLEVFAEAQHLGEPLPDVLLCANRCGKPRAADRRLCPGCLATAARAQKRFNDRGRARRDKFRRDNGIIRDCGVWTYK